MSWQAEFIVQGLDGNGELYDRDVIPSRSLRCRGVQLTSPRKSVMTFALFFSNVTDLQGGPLGYQRRLAEDPWPDLLEVPTGLGKTAAVLVAWLYKRMVLSDDETPRRLVYCLPMRVLVEQTAHAATEWANRAASFLGVIPPRVHVQMGGSTDVRVASWVETPEADAILIGTQDMLLSRALMRGYAMSRYHWPVHFALLHNDAIWVFDEVQLMGPGLATSTQLAALHDGIGTARRVRSLWLSATLNRDWLATVDFRKYLPKLDAVALTAEERKEPLADKRLRALKRVHKAPVALTEENAKQKAASYVQELAARVVSTHRGGTTLVIVNTVDRAQAVYRAIKEDTAATCLLLHARFRPLERQRIERRLRESDDPDRIVVATQAVEAGVDITSRVLFTELAPWPSMVQRFGRCNRYGEENEVGSDIYWVDIEDDQACSAPYEVGDFDSSRRKLATLSSAAPLDLPRTDEAAPLVSVLRRRDLYDLFDTDRDLSGFDVDVSSYIRDAGTPQLHVFWRDTGGDPNEPLQPPPGREELCPISIGQGQGLTKRTGWQWDSLNAHRRWIRHEGKPRPGMTLMLEAKEGGYDPELGFTLEGRPGKARVEPSPPTSTSETEGFDDDWRSQDHPAVLLSTHLADVAAEASKLCERLQEKRYARAVTSAARWHDVGKAHDVFQATLHSCDQAPPAALAKSPCRGRHQRRYFRHEVASLLAWFDRGDPSEDHDLIAYLIAAHHGKVRMSLRAMPDEPPAPDGRLFARGVWEGDRLLPLIFDGESLPEIELRLSVMALGEGPQGPSWTARTQRLLSELGPFRLAWLEAIVRIADWRASRAEQGEPISGKSTQASGSHLRDGEHD